MQKLLKNNWHRESGKPFARAQILKHEIHPEGLDVDRLRFFDAGQLTPESSVGHIISFLRGSGKLTLMSNCSQTFQLEEGFHLYLPPGIETLLEALPGTELLYVSSPLASQTRGKKLLIRNESFLSACASKSHSMRWVFTPQYLSRRIFLHHDPILLSKSGQPVSWFHTTMFDVTGLPSNEDGLPVFKMSYNSRTEVNFCYEVKGTARIRMAQHPYRETKQLWSPWLDLDGESTYHLNEVAGGLEEERCFNKKTQDMQTFRNKHEVYIVDGYVSLFCLFDPAPTGVECHRPGEYSDYEELSKVIGTKEYENHQREIAIYDEMLDQLSLAKALGKLDTFYETPIWEIYLQGLEAQAAIETDIINTLAAQGNGREHVLPNVCTRLSEKNEIVSSIRKD